VVVLRKARENAGVRNAGRPVREHVFRAQLIRKSRMYLPH